MTATPKILNEMFGRLLGIQVGPQVSDKLTPVIDGVIDKVHGNIDLETVQGQNTFRALICSMVVHGWGLGMQLVLGIGSSQLTTLALMLGMVGGIWAGLNFLVTALIFAGFTFVIAELYQKLAEDHPDWKTLDALASDPTSGGSAPRPSTRRGPAARIRVRSVVS